MMNLSIVEIYISIILSILIIAISWRTIFDIKSHGFYRLLGWECILVLFINNYRYWFHDPFGFTQILSWLFLFYSLFLIIDGVLLMKEKGKPNVDRKEDNLYKFEKTTNLIETGLFKYIRHPLYGSLLFLTWGIFFKNTTIVLLIISIMSSIFLIITAKIEEKENIDFFGQKYIGYMQKSKMFIPYIF